jgi:hypothetical protein
VSDAVLATLSALAVLLLIVFGTCWALNRSKELEP